MPPIINKERCCDCAVCADECPVGVIEIINESVVVADPDRCMGCGQCLDVCSEDAITLE
jgi:NAD-dependent dihydropyrimidine dehydrogenase PreA subunit